MQVERQMAESASVASLFVQQFPKKYFFTTFFSNSTLFSYLLYTLNHLLIHFPYCFKLSVLFQFVIPIYMISKINQGPQVAYSRMTLLNGELYFSLKHLKNAILHKKKKVEREMNKIWV